MKHLAMVLAISLGMAFNAQPVFSEDIPAPVSEVPESVGAEEGTLEEGGQEELPALEEGQEGEVTERGLRRFKLPQKKVPLKPRPRIILPKPKRPLRIAPSGSSPKPPSGGSDQLPRGEETPPVEPPVPVQPPQQCVWHTSDIIDPRIDISAQQRLMTMMSRGGEERLNASAMIGAVKGGTLAGILLAPRKAVSERGQRMTPPKGWWELIPPGQLGTCLHEPSGEPPMMLYRDKQGEANLDPSLIDHTLRTVWMQCGLPTPVPACSYLVDLHKPAPPPGSSDEKSHGQGELQVFVTGNGLALGGVHVAVFAQHKEPFGHQNFTNESDPGTFFSLSGVTNGEGIASFMLPPLAPGIQIHVTGPPGFLNGAYTVGGHILDKKVMIELSPINNPAS